jgi:hypothetical protein
MKDVVSDDSQNHARYHINRFIFDHGFAPNVDELANILGVSAGEVEKILQALADNHALVLHPNSFNIWVAHPFADFPTLFWVRTKEKQWWGNCAWCSLGIASLTNDETEIFTKICGEEEPVKLVIKDNLLVSEELYVHFPIPANKFWDNVVYTCSMMLVFRTKDDVQTWCERHHKPMGEILPISKVWELAKIWYGNYLDPKFERKTKEIAQSMFSKVNLTSNFWKM